MKTLMGALTELVYEDAKGKIVKRRWPMRGAPALVYDGRGRLEIVYAPRPAGEASAKAIREYQRTHWGDPGKGESLEGERARKPLVKIGKLVAVTYTIRKGNSAMTDWEHTFEGTKPSLLMHLRSGRFALRGGSYKVRAHGIVG